MHPNGRRGGEENATRADVLGFRPDSWAIRNARGDGQIQRIPSLSALALIEGGHILTVLEVGSLQILASTHRKNGGTSLSAESQLTPLFPGSRPGYESLFEPNYKKEPQRGSW